MNSPTGEIKEAEHSIPDDPKIRKACKIAYLGWYSKYGDYVVNGGILAESKRERLLDYVFTQQYIWYALGQSEATFKDDDIQKDYEEFKKDIDNQMKKIETRPSFVKNTITIECGETKVLTDSNNVLKDYNSIDVTKDGIRIEHTKGENTMKITVDENCNVETLQISDKMMKNWGCIKEETVDKDTTIYFTFEDKVQNQLYSLDYNDPVSMSLNLKIEQLGDLEIIKTNKNGDLVDGTVFTVNGKSYNGDVTVKNGRIKLEKLKKGIYTVKEKTSSDGYLLNTETYKIEVKPNTTVTLRIENDEPKGTLDIVKVDSETNQKAQGDATFEGAIYELYAAEDIYNKARTVKYYSNGDKVANRVMNKEGKTERITGLPIGNYICKEIASSKGYLLDTNEYKIEIKYKNQNEKIIVNSLTSKEKVKKQKIHIFKSGIKSQSGEVKGLANVEFTIKLASEVEKAYKAGYTYEEIWNGIDREGNKVNVNKNRVAEAQKIAPDYDKITTDNNGDCYTKDLPFGRYIGKETETPKDFETATDFYFSITNDESEIKEIEKKVKNIYINNEQLETYVRLLKRDLKTGKLVSASSATFKIRATADVYDRGNGKLIYKKDDIITQKVGNTVYDSFTTNSDNIIVPEKSYNSNNDEKGTVTTPLKLEVGSYEVYEISSPIGFLQLDKPVEFKIENIRDYDKDQENDYVIEVVVKNEQPTGTLIIDKKIILRDNVDLSLIDVQDFSNIKFRVSAKEDIIDKADNSIIYEKGTVIGEYNLDKDGNLKVENLPIGIYEVEEIETLSGLVLDSTKYEVKFEQKDEIQKVYEQTLNIDNITTLVSISKTDVTGEKEIVGAKLKVVDEMNNVIDTWTSTESEHKIEGLIAGKEYTLIEEFAPEGKVIATAIKFTVENIKDGQRVQMIDKVVEISKVDLTTGEELEGAELQIVDEQGNIIEEWTSTKEPHIVSGLEENKKYTLIEKISPYGFEIAEKIEFVVTPDKETQRVVMKDMPILTNIRLVKIDEETKEAIRDKFTFGLYEDEECTKLIKEYKSNPKEGFVEFDSLRYGIYFCKELSAPKNYNKSDKIIKIEINDKGVFVDNTQLENKDSIYSFEFANKKIETPKTGYQSNSFIYKIILLLSSIGLAVVAIVIKKRKSKKRK